MPEFGELLYNLAQIGLTVSAAAILLFVLRKTLKKRYPARAMCLVWAVLALRLLVPVQLTLPDPPVQVTPRTTYLAPVSEAAPEAEPAEPQPDAERWVTPQQAQQIRADGAAVLLFDAGQVLGALWLTGLLVFAGGQMVGYRRFRRALEKNSQPAERDTLRRVFEEQKRALGITRDIPLLVSSAADCPLLAGFRKPALYLPDEALDAQDAAFIFRHELTHFRRGDLWLKLALVAARAVHWFNPLVHLLARFAQEDIELACDDAVVRGMDVDARRAYGKTILRSVEGQLKKRALVSCFAGDKESLMRRFEGLFDQKVKRRGIALVVAAAVLVGTLGCAFSVGETGKKLSDADRLALAEQWAQRADCLGYTVKLDGEDTYVLYDMQWEDFPELPVPDRVAEKLTFEQRDGWQVTKGEAFAADGVKTLGQFKILYENDLGLPDPIAGGDMVLTEEQQKTWSDPVDAALDLLQLKPVGDPDTKTVREEIVDVTFQFDDRSEVTVTMVRQFDAGWLPQDFTYDGGKNARSAADLAGQYARGVTHKSGQFVYPIFSDELQQEFLNERQMDGYFNWKYGTSSPSYRDYALVPGADEDTFLAVFQMYGGGVDDQRSAMQVHTAVENGRRVIDRIDGVDEGTYTKSDLFELYYNSGLPWPTIPEDAERFNGASLDTLTRVRDAAQTVFGYFGENVEHTEGDVHEFVFTPWFESEVLSETDTEAVVRLHFTDESPSVDVQMRKTGAYWLPVGQVAQFDEDFHAYLVEGDSPVSKGALPVGATIRQAIENANGDIPILTAGQTILLEPMDGKLTETEAVLTDAVIHANGTLQYTDKETQVTQIRLTDVYDRGSAVYQYQTEHLWAEALSSTMTAVVYRGVTVSYTANGTDYTAAFVYRLASEGVPNTDYTITSTEYTNPTYGYTLTLPPCFVERGYAEENGDAVTFGMKNALPGYTDNPTDGGGVMTLYAEATASLQAQFGEDWEAGYPVPCKELTERDGLTYYLAFASDVQYDPSDEAISAAYHEMYQAAYAMDGDSISFDGQNEAQAGRARQQVLHDLARQHAYTLVYRDGSSIDRVTVEPDLTDNTCLLVVRYLSREREDYFTTVYRLWYENTDSITPARTESLLKTTDGVRSLADFRSAYPYEQGFPVFDQTGLEKLTELAAKPASGETPDLSTPEACAEYVLHLAGGDWGDRIGGKDDTEIGLPYRWDDGEMTIRMQRVQLSDSSPVLWLPFGYEGYLPQYPPYLSVVAGMMDYYPYRTTGELLQALEMGWVDGVYAESVFAELDKRWQQDADAIDQTIANSSEEIQALWNSHKAANPDIFGG